MPGDAHERAARKRLLQAQSAVWRLRLGQQLGHGLQPAWRTLDRTDRAWRWVRSNPLLCVGLGAALLVWKPRAVPGLATRAWAAWRLWRRWRHIAPVAVPWLQRWFGRADRGPPAG